MFDNLNMEEKFMYWFLITFFNKLYKDFNTEYKLRRSICIAFDGEQNIPFFYKNNNLNIIWFSIMMHRFMLEIKILHLKSNIIQRRENPVPILRIF